MTKCLHIMFCPVTPHKCVASLCRHGCCMRVGHVSSHGVIFVQHWTRVDIQEERAVLWRDHAMLLCVWDMVGITPNSLSLGD